VVTADHRILAERFERRGVRATGFSARRIEHLLQPSRSTALRDQISRWPSAINTDLAPQAYLANLQLWERSLTRAGQTADPTWTGLAERFAWLWLALPLVLWAAWQGLRLLRRRRDPGGDALFSIATTGAAGMAAEVVVLYACQGASGRLYTGLALLVGLFMAGLAAGAFIGRTRLSRRPRAGGVTADAAALALMLATGPVLSWAIDRPWVVATWSVVAGAVTGMAFPALLALAARRPGGDERKAAASIEAADHLGAALGALITGVIWLPVYGITTTCLLFAAFKAASLAGLAPHLRGRSRIDPGTA
jgi:spermidine synthase